MKSGDYVIYMNGDTCQIGQVTRTNDRGAFVLYHKGSTAALTPYDKLIPIKNAYVIQSTSLGKMDIQESVQVECLRCSTERVNGHLSNCEIIQRNLGAEYCPKCGRKL